MNFTPAVGAGQDALRMGRSADGSRAQLFAIVGCVAAVNGFSGKIATAVYSQPIASAILDLGGVSAIVWFAIGTLITIASSSTNTSALSSADRAVLGLTLLLSFVPLNFAAAVGLLFCGAYLAVVSIRESAERRIALIMIALTGPLIWGRFLLALIGPFLLRADAQLAGLLAGASVQGNVVSLPGEHGNLYVALGCSSVHNMSLAVLLFVAVTQVLALRNTPLLLLTCAGAMLAMAAVNVLRLATLARIPEYFDLIHTGWGGSLFGAVSFMAAGAVIVLGIRAELAR